MYNMVLKIRAGTGGDVSANFTHAIVSVCIAVMPEANKGWKSKQVYSPRMLPRTRERGIARKVYCRRHKLGKGGRDGDRLVGGVV